MNLRHHGALIFAGSFISLLLLMFLAMTIYTKTVTYEFTVNQDLSLTLVEAKEVPVGDKETESTLAFVDLTGKRYSQTLRFTRTHDSQCFDYYKSRMGQTIILKQEKGIATSFFGSHEFDHTIDSNGVIFEACWYAQRKVMDEKILRKKAANQ
jgi:hypothetical protein